MKPTISLCMIVRNEEGNLAECLSGVADLVDEIVIVDTGSTDGTKAEAARFDAKVVDFPWVDDFSAARNETRRHATGDWIFWLDADDRIEGENRDRLRALFASLKPSDAEGNPVYVMWCSSKLPNQNAEFRLSHGRMFPSRSGIGWRGAIHEYLVTSSGEMDGLELRVTDVVIRHAGYEDAEQWARKQQRDQRLLERQHLLNPDDPMTQFYLGRIHHGQGRYQEALRFLRGSIRRDPEGRLASTPQACSLAVLSLDALRRPEDAIQQVEDALRRFPDAPDLLFLAATLYRGSRRLTEAEVCLRRVISNPLPAISRGGVHADLHSVKARLLLGHVLCEQRRPAEAEAQYRAAINADPRCAEALLNLGRVLIQSRRLPEVGQLAARLDSCPGATMEASLMRAQVLIEEGRWNDARRWIDRAMQFAPLAPAPFVLLSDLLYREGADWRRCVEVSRRVLTMEPGQGEVRRRLAQLEAEGPRVSAVPGGFAVPAATPRRPAAPAAAAAALPFGDLSTAVAVPPATQRAMSA